MNNFSTYEELREYVEKNDNLVVIKMGDLRRIQGASKLGSIVRQTIAGELEGAGLGYFPSLDDLPYQEWDVRIYRKGKPIGDLIDAVLNPSASGDERLREAGSDEAANMIKQVRSLVCGD